MINNSYLEEKKYLEIVKDTLIKEQQYYEKELREIPKRYTKALQGDSFLVEGLMSTAASRLRMLELSKDVPYFGRIDFFTEGSNELAKIYIGKTGITDENRKSLVTDWRAPICCLYYDSNLGSVSYVAPCGEISGELKLKRQIIIKNGEIESVMDTDYVTNDELLRPYLSLNAENTMKIIIASIQKEQNQIIRRPINKNIIVQGVAGSGKTSVALHRIAYLVYTLGNNINTKEILILGPNKFFLKYISSILPELDVQPVEQKTYLDLVNDILNEKYTLAIQNELFNSKNNQSEIKKMNHYKSSLLYEKAIEKFMSNLLNNWQLPNIMIDGEEIYSAEKIKSILFANGQFIPNYKVACEYFLKDFKEQQEQLYDRLNEKYRKIYMKLPKDSPERKEAIEKSNNLSRTIKTNGEKIIKNYFKSIVKKPIDIYILFIENIEKYATNIDEETISLIKMITLPTLNKKQLSFEDLPAILYIYYLLTQKCQHYKHIVIDEAQDYGPFHIDAIKKNCKDSTFSIYGDLAQSIYSHRGIYNWEDIAKEIFEDRCEIIYLSKSYRTTIEITNNANKILERLGLSPATPVIRNGNEITYMDYSRDNDYKKMKIKEWINKGYKTIAIICKNEKEAKSTYEKLLNNSFDVKLITTKDNNYEGNVFVLTSELSKGLEFDAVLINDASDTMYDIQSPHDMHLLYVACTRALHELEILYDKTICEVFNKKENEKKIVKK